MSEQRRRTTITATVDRDRGVFMISVAAELAEMHPQTLRMYEQRGLIAPKRSPKGTRLYSQEDVERLRRDRILIDADPETGKRKLLQIFTQNAIGPIFFEIIQRKGNEGFGEGNFRALFESIERDQMRRGVL